MAIHNVRGKQGELQAVAYFLQRGYTILHCNWRYRYYEIDIIASREEKLHFIEVKTRHTLTYGYPEESVTRKKFASLKKGAEAFLNSHPGWERIQYDILSISKIGSKPDEYFLLEDVFI